MKKIIFGLLFVSTACFAGTETITFGPGGGTITYSSATASVVSFAKGFNFRASSGFVADGTNETYVLASDVYPTTRNGVTFGWAVDPNTLGGGDRDRDAGIDRRIAGMHFIGNHNTSTDTFRVDLPAAGVYTVQFGVGDAGANAKTNYIRILDDTVSLISFQPLNTLATPTFGDAAGNTYNAATWPSSEASVTKTFSSTICRVLIGDSLNGLGTDASIDHLFLTKQ